MTQGPRRFPRKSASAQMHEAGEGALVSLPVQSSGGACERGSGVQCLALDDHRGWTWAHR